MNTSPIRGERAVTFQDFSKSRFTAMKASNPKLTDKDIVQKLKEEWNSTSIKASNDKMSASKRKSNLAQRSGIEQQPSIQAKKKLEFSASKKSSKKQQKKQEIKEESQRLSQRRSINSTPAKNIKTKAIMKEKDDESQKKFSNFYTKKLRQEHPKWTKFQTAQIVKLLWRRSKMAQVKKIMRTRPFKPMTGRAYFGNVKRSEGMTNEQIKSLWKSFPKETKNYWSSLGTGAKESQFLTPQKKSTILALPSTEKTQAPSPSRFGLSFLNKSI